MSNKHKAMSPMWRSGPQSVLAEQLHRARLRSFLAGFLGECHAGAGTQAGKAAVEHAVAMKIDFAAVAGFQETELAGRIEPRHRSDRRAIVLLHQALQPANVILQPPLCALEGVVDGKGQIGVPLVRLRDAADIDFPTVGERQADIHFVESAVLMMATGSLQRDPATRHPAVTLFELGHVPEY